MHCSRSWCVDIIDDLPKPDTRTISQKSWNHGLCYRSQLGKNGDSARVLSVTNGELTWSSIRDTEFFLTQKSACESLEPLAEIDQLLVDEALGTLKRLKAEGTCQIPSVSTSSSPVGKSVLWYDGDFNKTEPSSGRIGSDPVPYQIDFTDPASFRSLFDTYTAITGTTTINEIYYTLDDHNVTIVGTATNPTGTQCVVRASANRDGTYPPIPMGCDSSDKTLGPFLI